ncbi:MAG TPA: hypothetical protein VFO35_07565, partial [Steroidobacteraceae bacterium]|nr:hypothetical protein [Steroidobacteraceae bacterium]
MKVFGSPWPFSASILLCTFAFSAFSGAAEDAPCTCPDMLDLANRNNQVKAAIQAYEQQLATWSAAGGAPAADEAARIAFQEGVVEPPMAAVKDHRANSASAKTFPDCTTTFDAPTQCLRVLMEQHEQVHRDACRAHTAETSPVADAIRGRWQTLADYAHEEIEGYKAERIYIEAALSNLERDCRYTLEF